jgi:hypothetical protein
MGTEPVEKDIPIEPGDLSFETQQALMLFSILPDKIEGMNGIWLGKEFSGIGDIFDFYEIEDRREVFELLTYIIGQYNTYYERQRQSKLRS